MKSSTLVRRFLPYYRIQTLVILYAALGIVGVFLGDVLMMLVDPRITLTGKEAAR